MTFDRRVAGGIEAFEFLGRHLRTDKVILVAGSIGTLPAVSLVKRRPDRPVGSEAWNANLARTFRANLATPKLDRRLLFPCWRWGLTAATRRRGWWVLRLLAELAEGLLLLRLESERTV